MQPYWNLLLQRRLAWIRHNRDTANIDLQNLLPGPDGLPTCNNLPSEPEGFQPIPFNKDRASFLDLKLLFQPANRVWAQEHIVEHDTVERVTRILEERSTATHLVWDKVLDWLMNLDVTRDIKSLDLMERIMDATRVYTRDSNQLTYLARQPHCILEYKKFCRTSCVQTMCRIIGLDVDDKFTWLDQPFKHKRLVCREDHIRNIIQPAHQALSGKMDNQVEDITAYVAERVRDLLEAEDNLALLRRLDHELVVMMHQVRKMQV
jgi:hypothetical protein